MCNTGAFGGLTGFTWEFQAKCRNSKKMAKILDKNFMGGGYNETVMEKPKIGFSEKVQT